MKCQTSQAQVSGPCSGRIQEQKHDLWKEFLSALPKACHVPHHQAVVLQSKLTFPTASHGFQIISCRQAINAAKDGPWKASKAASSSLPAIPIQGRWSGISLNRWGLYHTRIKDFRLEDFFFVSKCILHFKGQRILFTRHSWSTWSHMLHFWLEAWFWETK